MSLPVTIRPAARADIESIHDSLKQLKVGLGGRFAVRLKEVLERIEFMPEMYAVISRTFELLALGSSSTSSITSCVRTGSRYLLYCTAHAMVRHGNPACRHDRFPDAVVGQLHFQDSRCAPGASLPPLAVGE